MKVGNGFDPDTMSAPHFRNQFNQVNKYVQEGLEEGAEVIIGGDGDNSDGYFFKPTVFTKIDPSMKIAREEILALYWLLQNSKIWMRSSA